MDNNMTFLNACRNGQKGIVQIFLKKLTVCIQIRNENLHACAKRLICIVSINRQTVILSHRHS